ncbi:MAG: hypothetical protein ABJ056_02785, partial [Halioglobus sp.]
ERVQVQGIRRFYAAVVGSLRSIPFDRDATQHQGSIEQKGGRRASWCKDKKKMQVLLPQKTRRQKKRTQTLFVMALVVGYAPLSRSSRAARSVSCVNPEGALCI